MTDLDTLHRAFAELERRADAHGSADLTVRPVTAPARPAWHRPVLVGATAAALVAAVAGTVALTTDHARPSTPAAGTAPSSFPPTAPASSAPTAPATSSGAPSVTPTPVETSTASRFTAALDGVATFTVTPQGGNADARYLVGVLTSASGSGGFDVQPTPAGSLTTCSEGFACTQTTQADGSSLAVGTATVLDPDGGQSTGLTYEVLLTRPDGTGVLFHLSNQRDPKGMSEQLSAQPPLTVAQMTAVVTSPAWTR